MKGIALIVALYLLVAGLYSVTTPLFEVSDELWHYPMVKYLADNGLQLPPQDPANPGPWRQEGSQPPLYYMLAAVLTAGIDTSDMDEVRRVNPHADIGVIRPDGNLNMMVHRADLETFPWRGTVLAVYVARFFSILLGLGTVLVTYRLAQEVFPDQLVIALGASAFVAFLPMFLFISASVNNDNLSNLLGNLLILLIIRLLKSPALPGWRTYTVLGVVVGTGLLAKFNIGFLIPFVALTLLIISVRFRNWRPLIIGGIISGSLTILIAGWWYWRNLELYGDPTGLNRFLEIVGQRAVPANLAQLWSERESFTRAFWGFFGGMNLPLPDTLYTLLNIIGGLALLSAGIWIILQVWQRKLTLPQLIIILWPLVTFISYLRWTAETPASQGRLIFGALSCIAIWFAVGLSWWLPRRAASVTVGMMASGLAVTAALIPPLVIGPAYRLPELRITAAAEQPIVSYTQPSGGQIDLLHVQAITPQVRPEEYAQVTLRWRIEEAFSQNWSLFVHLVTEDEVIVGQRDIYPGGGKLAVSDLEAGTTWEDTIAVWIPAAAFAPSSLGIRVGWYDLQTGERLAPEDNQPILASVNLLPREANPFNTPNPIRVNFGGWIELVGYDLSDLSPAAGESVDLTLYWRALQPMTTDYKVFTSIIDPPTLTKYAASDGMPVNWQAPTSTWQPEVIIEDQHTLVIDPQAQPGIYEIELGLYTEADGQRLRVFTPDGGQADNFIYLTRVRIEPAQSGS